MAFGRKKKDESKDKSVKVVPIKVDKPKNPSMWCVMHSCPKTSCPQMHN